MANEIDLQKVFSILDGKAAEIKRLDENLIIETTGVAMALAALRESLDKMEIHLDNREPEKASHVGYQEVAHNFVYVQRTLAGLQTATHQKEAFISNIAHEASVAYEDVAPCVETKMQSSVKKSTS
jgi:hypothetical protein